MVEVEVVAVERHGEPRAAARGDEGAAYQLVLRARGSHRELGIVIGAPEALAIEVGRTGEQLPRPMTHDFTSALLAALDDVTVLRVVLTEVVEGSYRAAFVLRHGDQVVEVDCRPTDAIAVAVRLDVPIVAADPVAALFTAA